MFRCPTLFRMVEVYRVDTEEPVEQFTTEEAARQLARLLTQLFHIRYDVRLVKP